MDITNKLKRIKIPTHLALILDGNGRWAKKRNLNRTDGHSKGFETLINICKTIRKIGIKYLTIYAFSTENWNRPKKEVDFLLDLFEKGIDRLENEYKDDDIKLIISGELDRFSENIQNKINRFVANSSSKSGFVLNLCLNYGGRQEIVRAVNKIINEKLECVDEKKFSKYLYTADLPDPDFVIRTSGEQRLSNFLPWQTIYSELYFPKVFWPAFNDRCLLKALKVYSKRDRRFGRVKK